MCWRLWGRVVASSLPIVFICLFPVFDDALNRIDSGFRILSLLQSSSHFFPVLALPRLSSNLMIRYSDSISSLTRLLSCTALTYSLCSCILLATLLNISIFFCAEVDSLFYHLFINFMEFFILRRYSCLFFYTISFQFWLF